MIWINNIFIRRNDRIEGLISYFIMMMYQIVIGYVCAFTGLIERYIPNPSAAYDLKRAGEVTVGIRPSLYGESLLMFIKQSSVDCLGFYGILFVDSLVFQIKNHQCYFISPLFSIVRNAWIISSILHPPISGDYHVSVSSWNSSRQRCRKSHQLPSQSKLGFDGISPILSISSHWAPAWHPLLLTSSSLGILFSRADLKNRPPEHAWWLESWMRRWYWY